MWSNQLFTKGARGRRVSAGTERRGKLVIFPLIVAVMLMIFCGSWGFLVHRTVNQLAIYELPDPMTAFFWKYRDSLVKEAPRPDIRRRTDKSEEPRHFIDIESYGDSAAWKMPLHLADAMREFTLDTLKKYGMVPYVIQEVERQLTGAMRARNRDSILYYAADLGHYVGDANVPLHTALNYDGQLSGQRGIHSLWESLVPDQTMNGYRLRDGHKARYLADPAQAVWEAIRYSHSLVDRMLEAERDASAGVPDTVKYHMVTPASGKSYKAYTKAFARLYAAKLGSMVNDQLLRSADMIADFWYTAWVDAGKPDLDGLLTEPLSVQDKKDRKAEFKAYKKNQLIEKGLLGARKMDGSE